SYTTKNEEWHFKIQPSDGTDFGLWIGCLSNVTISNSLPIPTVLEIFPSDPVYTINTLVASFAGTDPDNDEIINIAIRWYNGSVAVPVLENQTDVPSSYTKKGEDWRFEIRQYDGEGWSDWTDSQLLSVLSQVTIQNSIPIIENITLSGGRTTTENITLNYDFYDADGDSDQSTIEWKVGLEIDPLEGTATTLPFSEFDAGDVIWVKITPIDSEGGMGFPISSYELAGSNVIILVGDSAPQFNQSLGIPTILADHPDNQYSFSAIYPIYVNYSAFVIDIDSENSDPIFDISIEKNTEIIYANITEITGSQYRWYKYNTQNDQWELQNLLTSSYVDPYYLHRDDQWIVSVRPRDRYGKFGDWVNSTSIIIGNSQPIITNFLWNDLKPSIEDDISFIYVYLDFDFDPENQSMTIVRWYLNNGTEIIAARNSTTLSHLLNVLIKGDGVYVVISPHDGEDYGINYTSSVLMIYNARPIANNVFISPYTPYTNNSLILNWTYFDSDGDDENQTSVIVHWYRNGILVPELDNLTEIEASLTSKGEVWSVSIQVFDGFNYSLAALSSSKEIKNSFISISQIIFNSNNTLVSIYADTNLFTDIDDWEFIDLDGDGYTDYSIRWYLDGLHQAVYDNLTNIPASQLTKEQEWYCVVQLFDGDDWSENKTSQIIQIINKAPEVTTLEFINHIYTEFIVEDEAIEIIYDFSDVDGDNDSSIIKWYMNGTHIPQFDNKTHIPSNYTNPGEVWHFLIVPSDGIDENNPILSQNMTIESRPMIISYGNIPLTDDDGHYILWIKANDSRNPIQTVTIMLPTGQQKQAEWNTTHYILDYSFDL
ncbi:MAG: hypothetical protein ACFFDT_20050, partial [Candidatus Hodarchaeota archaeon]